MQDTGTAIYRINELFTEYATGIETGDTKRVANCFAQPCTFITDEGSVVYTSLAKLEGTINQGKRFYKKHHVTTAYPDIRNKRFLSERLVQVRIWWQYLDEQSKMVYQCEYYYIIRLDEEQEWKIELAVPVDEKEQIEALNKK